MNTQGIWGNVWFKMFVLNKDEEIPCHSHKHRHVTYVAHGSAEALINGKPAGVFYKGEGCPVEKNVNHGYRALEDGTTLCCSFAVRKKDEIDPADWDECLRMPEIAATSPDIAPEHFTGEQKYKVVKQKTNSEAL